MFYLGVRPQAEVPQINGPYSPFLLSVNPPLSPPSLISPPLELKKKPSRFFIEQLQLSQSPEPSLPSPEALKQVPPPGGGGVELQ